MKNGSVSNSVILKKKYIVRWYHRFEMQLLLEKAGFSKVEILDEPFEQNEQAVSPVNQSLHQQYLKQPL